MNVFIKNERIKIIEKMFKYRNVISHLTGDELVYHLTHSENEHRLLIYLKELKKRIEKIDQLPLFERYSIDCPPNARALYDQIKNNCR